ncbi:protein kinase [Paenibacillus timonensis]|nr:protein kinase family protein [Paenibacillus timonensis]MUG86286.1 protein kinase [Paenibacillus timonensis]
MRMISFFSSFAAAWRDYRLDSGTQLANRYTVRELIGEGSYGLTYKCTDETTGSIVAVKQARPSKGEYAKQLLVHEANVLKTLHHPRIPGYLDQFEEGRNSYLVMTFLRGATLEDLIFGQGRRYDEAESVRVTLQLLELVDDIHRQGFVHLDLRIPNVVFQEEELYLIDFGLSRGIGESPIALPLQGRWHQREHAASRAFIPAEPQSDLEDVGHFLLFLLYSTFDTKRQSSHPTHGNRQISESSWQDELHLSSELTTRVERLLQLRDPYAHVSEAIADLQALRSLQR